MAWDIYGNHLQKGNCEVHPWVGEEYPCYQCRQSEENYQRQNDAEREHAEAIEGDYYKSLSIEYCENESWIYRRINNILYFLTRLTIYFEKQKAKIEARSPF